MGHVIYILVAKLINGIFIGTAFAYGQTSSGKTFTMNGSETDPGIIHQAVKDIFTKIQMVSCLVDVIEIDVFVVIMATFWFLPWLFGTEYLQISDREFLIRVSYMEIYNEEINDLFAVENQKLQIHESLEVGY